MLAVLSNNASSGDRERPFYRLHGSEAALSSCLQPVEVLCVEPLPLNRALASEARWLTNAVGYCGSSRPTGGPFRSQPHRTGVQGRFLTKRSLPQPQSSATPSGYR